MTEQVQVCPQLLWTSGLWVSLSVCFTMTGPKSPTSLTRNTPGISTRWGPDPADPQFTEERHFPSVSFKVCFQNPHFLLQGWPPSRRADCRSTPSFRGKLHSASPPAGLWPVPATQVGLSHIPSSGLFYIKAKLEMTHAHPNPGEAAPLPERFTFSLFLS